MFASILDRYPGTGPDAGRAGEPAWRDRLDVVLRAQFDAGMGMLADGRVHDVTTGGAAIEAAVRAWNDANSTARDLATGDNPSLEPPLVKACLLGPWTACQRDGSTRDRSSAAARVLEAVNLLFEAGASVVQLVEDGLVDLDPEDVGAVAAANHVLELATQSVGGHITLSVGGGNVDRLGAAFFFDLPIASYAFDLIHGPDNWRLISRAPADRGILCGVADCRTDADDAEAVMIWAARYAASLGNRGLERVGLTPSSGLETLSAAAAGRKLAGLSAAARKAGLPADDLAAAIDPRAVDARAAALGRVDPRARRTR